MSPLPGEKDSKRIEYVDHLHEHFLDPVRVRNGVYQAPDKPGFSIQMKEETFNKFQFDSGADSS